MKIQQIKGNKNKLIELNLINSKIINKKKLFANQTIDHIKYQLKKSLQTIYKYQIEGKKILFIGSESKYNSLIIFLKMTKHTWLPGFNWQNGILTRKPKYSKTESFSKKLIEIQKKHDLIVILNYDLNKHNAVEEGYLNKTPVISFNINLNIFNNKCSYKVPGNFQFSEKAIRDNFFFSLLEATLKKGHYFRNKKK